ncbi:glycoside hydrolase domain-containing protein [Nocardioides sp. MAHUQ-72]|uniref:glycoside hydrolase domain-containing protein n=1 Tax=unclassified Nocardioides TaxID=2615069 RepID=UPI00361D0F77
MPATAATAAEGEPGTFTGEAFDACSAPASSTMDAWLASPYRAIGVYVGGVNRACAQPQLTATWVAHQQAAGWHLLPIYLGLQAPCTTSNKKYLIDPTQPRSQGRAEATAAVAAADGLGLPPGSTLFFDMEAYRTGDASCSTAVLRFLGAWTSRLHDLGYFSGVYSSLGSGVADLVQDYESTTRPHPDYLWFARYDENAGTDNDTIPDSYWSPHRRLHQYRGGHDETYGGVTINIDNDYVDVRPLPGPRFGDFTGNGWGDLLARDRATGTLHLYAGNGTNLEPRTSLGVGRFGSATRYGDFDRDGHEDVIARDGTTGYLWLYPGTGTGLGPRVRLGTGWDAMREITAVGDLDGDGFADLLAVSKASGHLFFYPGRGNGLGPRTRLGAGWNAMSELTGIGDLTGDGRRDLLARGTATGTLYLYPGKGVGFGPRTSLGTGWSGLRGLVGVGNFDRRGAPDLMAVDASTGDLYLYPGRTGGLRPRVRLSGGWSDRGPLL